MSYDWNSNKNELPSVTRTSASSSTTTSAPVQQTITASLPPPTSTPLATMRYHRGGGEINSHQIMSHQVDRILPHGHTGKKKRGVPYSRCSSAERNEFQQNYPPSSEQDSGTQQKRSHSLEDQPDIQDMEMELDFLKGECTTIDIILASLRTAFLRDGTDTFRNTSSFIPLATSVSSFSSFSLSSLSALSTPIPTLASSSTRTVVTSTSSSSSSSPSSSPSEQQSQQHKDREKEMRVGYDDLMLQVRQLEKKVDSLEYKIRQHYMDQHKKSRH